MMSEAVVIPSPKGGTVKRGADGPGLATAARRSSWSPVDAATLEAARTFLGRVEATYAPVAALIYGSRARGDHGPDSDADLAVILEGEGRDRSAVGRVWSAIAFDVLLETGIRIHALPLWEAELRRPDLFSNPALIANIEREGVRL